MVSPAQARAIASGDAPSTAQAVAQSASGGGSGLINPMTTAGDLIVGGAAGAPARLAKGADGTQLTMVSGAQAWAADTGLVNPMTTAGDIIIGGVAGAAGRLGIGTANYVLTSLSGAPAWAALPATGSAPPINTQTGTSYHPVLADAPQSSNYEGWVTMNNAAANTITLDPHSTTAWVTGTLIPAVQLGAGQTAFVAGAGVTFLNPSSLTARAQNSTIWAKYLGSDTWLIGGDLT
jgi:hypothetical protein